MGALEALLNLLLVLLRLHETVQLRILVAQLQLHEPAVVKGTAVDLHAACFKDIKSKRSQKQEKIERSCQLRAGQRARRMLAIVWATPGGRVLERLC